MGEVTALVAELREEEPPAVAFDMTQGIYRTGRGSTPQAQPALRRAKREPEGTGR